MEHAHSWFHRLLSTGVDAWLVGDLKYSDVNLRTVKIDGVHFEDDLHRDYRKAGRQASKQAK